MENWESGNAGKRHFDLDDLATQISNDVRSSSRKRDRVPANRKSGVDRGAKLENIKAWTHTTY